MPKDPEPADAERHALWARITVDENDCWVWPADTGRTGAELRVRLPNGWALSARRLAWRMFRGPLPKSARVRSNCPHHNPRCVNPDHMALGPAELGRRPTFHSSAAADEALRRLAEQPELTLKEVAEQTGLTWQQVAAIRAAARRRKTAEP